MKVTTQDQELFFRLWNPFLLHINTRADLAPDWKDPGVSPTGEQVRLLTAFLCEHPEVTDEWLAANPQVTPAQRKIVAGWKRCWQGDFFLMRFLSNSAVALTENEEFFQVVSMRGDWRRMFSGVELPILLKGTFVPFRNMIVAEGAFTGESCEVDSRVFREMEELYAQAKKRGEVRTSL